MNANALHILADGTDEMIKLIFGAVFVLIWIVGGLMSATAKKKPKTKTPEKSWDEIFRELSGEAKRPQQQQPPPPPPSARFDPPPPPRPAPQVRRPQPTVTTTVHSGPPSGPAVRKKLRRKQRTEVIASAPPPPPPPPPTDAAVITSPVLEVATESLLFVHNDISKTEIGSGKVKRTSAAGGAVKQLHDALRPESLRYQFILTEILQPPKALREER